MFAGSSPAWITKGDVMGYIRSNEDYYESMGYSPCEARIQARMFEMGADDIDYGFCNRRKAREAEEEERSIRVKAVDSLAKEGKLCED
jgi:hypothetical protein